MSTSPCHDDWVFPLQPQNRPGLNRINFRIGTYADFRQELLRQLNFNQALASWTHREPDDPGIALLEGAAILGDILTFYQELYANEAFLRTAQWPESIADLVRLLGYRLSPGLGGKARFAFQVIGPDPVVVPQGFPVQAQLQTGGDPADFETSGEITAYPELNQFQLFQPLDKMQVWQATQEFYACPQDPQVADWKPGDRLLLSHSDPGYDYLHTRKAKIVVIDKIWNFHSLPIVRIKGQAGFDESDFFNDVSAVKLGRTFNHFGHNAAPEKVIVDDTHNPKVYKQNISFQRSLDLETSGDLSPSISSLELPLDREVNDLSPGIQCVVQAPVTLIDQNEIETDAGFLAIFSQIAEVKKNAYTWGTLNGSVTVLTLADSLALWPANHSSYTDVRQMQVHEVVGTPVTLKARPLQYKEPGDEGMGRELDGKMFCFYGSEAAAQALINRPVIVQADDKTAVETSCLSAEPMTDDFSKCASGWSIGLSDDFTEYNGNNYYDHFSNYGTVVKVFGNISDATQGKTQPQVVLGSGDNRQVFQTFKLPKKPLTYLNDPDVTPPAKPELDILVNELYWQWVPTLFGRGADEEIYITREDADGNSWVQFGDGKTGSRLPSGYNNVEVVYRTGVAATGPIKTGNKPQAGARLEKLDQMLLPVPVGYGSPAESGDHAQQTAPGKFQSLGRLVSLEDYEKEAQAISGVLKAQATWDLANASPVIHIAALMNQGHAVDEVRTLMAEYNRSRGPARYPIKVDAGDRTWVGLQLNVICDGSRPQDLLQADIEWVLGLWDDETKDPPPNGLFSLAGRTFVQDEYAGRVEGIVQDVPGVSWVKVTGFSVFPEGTDPRNADLLSSLAFHAKAVCPALRILALCRAQLSVQFNAPDPTAPAVDASLRQKVNPEFYRRHQDFWKRSIRTLKSKG